MSDDLKAYAGSLSAFGRQCLHLNRLAQLANLRKEIRELLLEYQTVKEELMIVRGEVEGTNGTLPLPRLRLKGCVNGWRYAVCLTCHGDVLDSYEYAAHRAQGHVTLEYHETNGTKLAN